MRTTFIFIISILCSAGHVSFAQYKEQLELKVIGYHHVDKNFYKGDKDFFALENKKDQFVVVELFVKNNSERKAQLNLNNLELEGSGFGITPGLVNGKYYANALNLKPGKSDLFQLVFSFPKELVAQNIRMIDGALVPLSEQPIDPKVYFDKDWKATSNLMDAKYCRLTEHAESGWIIRDYYINDTLQMESYVSDVHPIVREGMSVWYHDNGKVSRAGSYVNDKQMGIFQTYFETGEIKSLIEHFTDSVSYLQFWDENGDPLLVNGAGNVTELNKDGDVDVNKYLDYRRKVSFTIRQETMDSVYVIVDSQAEYKGGMQSFYRFIADNMSYPSDARRMGVQGTVYVMFIINQKGEPEEVKTVKGIGVSCDQESERVIRQAKSWIPAMVDFQPVKQKMVLPIIFKLSN